MNNQYDNFIEALDDLNKKGYNQNFRLTPNGLYCPKTLQTFSAKNVKIIEFHRFEGDTDMSDMAIIYVIEASNDCKGVIIDAFGTYANSDLGEFLKQVQYRTT